MPMNYLRIWINEIYNQTHKSIQKRFQKIKKQNKDLNILKKVIDMLANDEILPDKYRDHLLIGNYKGKHECHLEPDWLLIYEYLEDELILFLTRTGSHSDLF